MKAFCLICDKDVSYTVKSVKEKRIIKGKEIIYDAEHAFCNECGEFLFVYEIERKNQIKAFKINKKMTI